MALTSTITRYNENWPALFLAEQARIAEGFEAERLAIHPVGSTAVPCALLRATTGHKRRFLTY